MPVAAKVVDEQQQLFFWWCLSTTGRALNALHRRLDRDFRGTCVCSPLRVGTWALNMVTSLKRVLKYGPLISAGYIGGA